MARRPKQPSILEIAIAENWKVSAAFAAGLSIITLVVIPLVTNPILKVFALALRPIGVFLAVIFGLIALVKFLRQKSTTYQYGSLQPNTESKLADWPDMPRAPGELTVAERSFLFFGNGERLIKRPTEWSLDLIREIEWKKFEELSTAYCVEIGVRAEETSVGADGGIDIKLYEDDSGIPTSIAQCKAWNSRQVGVKQIREFLGVMTHEKIAKGFYMTSGEYTDDAKKVANANGITLIDGETLLRLIEQLPEVSQKKLLSVATEGDYTTPSCPSCGVKMVRRSGRRGGFWGCKNYPKCRQVATL